MTALADRVALGSGASFWSTAELPELGIRSLRLSDGPHGLRKQPGVAAGFGLLGSEPATCFPTASALAASWDVELLEEVGRAIGLEAVDQGVDVVLGPGVNMKRSPLCGRNFEYFSEDPLLSGRLAAAWIRGVQSTGTGTSLKHFALNNQEHARMTLDVRVDERAMREYYLPAFEIAIRESDPTTVMCAYNLVEGVYCSDHRELIGRILREEWGYRGVVMTDWGAMHDRIEAYRAGVDLEMPGHGNAHDQEILDAVGSGLLDEAAIDASVERMAALAARIGPRAPAPSVDRVDAHHELARRAAAESAVLLQNAGDRLPLEPGSRVAVIGALAEHTRFQGTGSSQVTPTRTSSLLEGIARYASADHAPGYTLADRPNARLLEEAVRLASAADRVVVCVGLTDAAESEGYDRTHLRLPANQLALLDALGALDGLGERVVVVLVGGSAIEMPWADRVAAVLHLQLAGQAVGDAAADLLFGVENPSGKLAETYPLALEDLPSTRSFGDSWRQAVYLESMYCGYRYFTTAGRAVRFPFGHGLSYTAFSYRDLRVERTGEHGARVTCSIRNEGTRTGAEIVQVYVRPPREGAHRPERELKGFAKLRLEPGESREVTIELDRRAFAVYDPQRRDWVVESGEYEVLVGASATDVRLRERLGIEGVAPAPSTAARWYHELEGEPTIEDFLTIHPPFPLAASSVRVYDLESSILEMRRASLVGRIVHAVLERAVAKGVGGRVDYGDPQFRMLFNSTAGMPIHAMMRMSPGSISLALARFLVDSANGRSLAGLWRLLRSPRSRGPRGQDLTRTDAGAAG